LTGACGPGYGAGEEAVKLGMELTEAEETVWGAPPLSEPEVSRGPASAAVGVADVVTCERVTGEVTIDGSAGWVVGCCMNEWFAHI